MPKSKKFIDRKHSVTFHLVHRSQQDPLTADETAPQRVLLPVTEKPKNEAQEKKKEEQVKYGIYFDDEYNYLQHMRDANTQSVEWEKVEKIEAAAPSNLKLPSSVFASKVEEDVGLLNKAAPHSGPRLDLDPDIVAAMDDDFNYDDPDNELEDNFMKLANVEGEERSDFGSDFGSDENYNDEELDEVASLDRSQHTFADEETKSRFTEYSMSSSVMRRNEQLTLLDGRFEKMYTAYDENEIGALDTEEIEGYVDPNSDVLLQCLDEFEKNRRREQLEKDASANRPHLEQLETDSEDDEDLDRKEISEKEKWDCETILSTYSNIYNHPKLISEPKNNYKIIINPRTGMPVNILGQNKLTTKVLSQFNAENDTVIGGGPKSMGGKSVLSQLSTLSIRAKDESPEEKRVRKQNLREYRKVRREEKKANMEAFKEEAKRQQKIAINNSNNVQGNRIL